MGKRLQEIREKLGISSGRAIVHLVIAQIALQLLWWVLGKMFSNIPEIVIGWGYLAIFIAGIFAVALYLPKLSPMLSGANKVNNRKEQRTEDVFLKEVLKSNQAKIYEAIKGRITQWDFSGFGKVEPYFEINFEITNSSIFTTHLKGVSGYIKIGVNPLVAPPQVNDIWGIEQGDSVSITLRQPISPQTLAIISIAGKNNIQIKFDLGNLVFEFETTTKGYEGITHILKGGVFTFIPKENTYCPEVKV